MDTTTLISIGALITFINLGMAVYNFFNGRKREVVSDTTNSDRKFEQLNSSLLEFKIQLGSVAQGVNDLRVEIKSMRQDVKDLELKYVAMERDVKTAFTMIEELKKEVRS